MSFSINSLFLFPSNYHFPGLDELFSQAASAAAFDGLVEDETPAAFSTKPSQQENSIIDESLLWDGSELSGQEVEDFLISINEKKSTPFQSKRGRWASEDIKFLHSYVQKDLESKEEHIQDVWTRVSNILHRNPDECKKRYFNYIGENPTAEKESFFVKKKNLPFTGRDVGICEYAIKKFNLIRADGLLDMKRLSQYTDRAYSSLRYNIYLSSDSVFSTNPFFTPFRQKYREIHKLDS